MKVLHIEDLSKSFGRLRVLDCVTLDLEEGEILAVLGPSGCGKTTLLRTIAGFEGADSGTITIHDEVALGPGRFMAPEQRRVGYVPQEGALFPHMSVAQNVAYGLSRAERARGRVQEILALVGVDDLCDRRPDQLSGGQQQRVALARALAPRPRIVLLDEPFNALDASLRTNVRTDVVGALRQTRASVVLVTHDQDEAFAVADRIAVMREGRVIQVDTPLSLYQHPVDLATAAFVGEANFVDAVIGAGWVQTAIGTLEPCRSCAQMSGPVTAMVRPEQVVVGTLEMGHHAVVECARFQGGRMAVQLRVTGQPELRLMAHSLNGIAYQPGQTVGIQFTGRCMVYSKPPGCDAPSQARFTPPPPNDAAIATG